MKLFKRTVASVLALLFVFSLSAVMPKAADAEKWTFIDGINITRSVNTAIIYRGINSTGQNQWGHNVVVDAEGTVTDIIQGSSPNLKTYTITWLFPRREPRSNGLRIT